MEAKPVVKRGIEEDSIDDKEMKLNALNRKRKANDAASMRSGKTSTSRYTAGGKGIHRPVGATDAVSMKSGNTAKSGKSEYTDSEYSLKKANGDMKKEGKVDPHTNIPFSRNFVNKRSRVFESAVKSSRKGAFKGMKSKIQKSYKK